MTISKQRINVIPKAILVNISEDLIYNSIQINIPLSKNNLLISFLVTFNLLSPYICFIYPYAYLNAKSLFLNFFKMLPFK